MYRGPDPQNNLVLVRMADVDDEEAELYGASAANDVKLADSSTGNNESSLDLDADGIGEKDDDDEANDNAEDDDGCDIIYFAVFFWILIIKLSIPGSMSLLIRKSCIHHRNPSGQRWFAYMIFISWLLNM